jgi:CDP-glucose 4,6-dehydratase
VRYPNSSRPWQHVLDLVNSYVQIGNRIVSGQGQLVNTEFNVGTDPKLEYSVVDLIETFRLKGIGVDIQLEEPKVHEATKLQISSLRSHALLGWSPNLNFSSTVGLTAEWYRLVCVDGANAYETANRQVMDFILGNGE